MHLTNDLDNSDSYLASENALAKAKKYRNTTTEENLDATLLEAHKTYKNVTILEFDGVNPGETRNVFFTHKTTPEMIKDTSATSNDAKCFCPK